MRLKWGKVLRSALKHTASLRRKCWCSRCRRITCWSVKQFPGCYLNDASLQSRLGSGCFFTSILVACAGGKLAWDCNLGSSERTEVRVGRDWKKVWCRKYQGDIYNVTYIMCWLLSATQARQPVLCIWGIITNWKGRHIPGEIGLNRIQN